MYDIETLWAEALQLVVTTLIIHVVSIIACSLTSLFIGISGMYKILCNILMFSLDQLTFKLKMKLMFPVGYGEYKPSNKRPSMDHSFFEKSISNSQMNIYSQDSIGETENSLSSNIKNKDLRNTWHKIQREGITRCFFHLCYSIYLLFICNI